MMEDEQISQQINRQTNNARRNRTKRREEKTQINQKISAHSEDMEGDRAGGGGEVRGLGATCVRILTRKSHKLSVPRTNSLELL